MPDERNTFPILATHSRTLMTFLAARFSERHIVNLGNTGAGHLLQINYDEASPAFCSVNLTNLSKLLSSNSI